jgi:hypothetical protein
MSPPRRCYYPSGLEAVLQFSLARWVSVGDERVRTPIWHIGGLTRDLNRLVEPTLAVVESGSAIEFHTDTQPLRPDSAPLSPF